MHVNIERRTMTDWVGGHSIAKIICRTLNKNNLNNIQVQNKIENNASAKDVPMRAYVPKPERVLETNFGSALYQFLKHDHEFFLLNSKLESMYQKVAEVVRTKLLHETFQFMSLSYVEFLTPGLASLVFVFDPKYMSDVNVMAQDGTTKWMETGEDEHGGKARIVIDMDEGLRQFVSLFFNCLLNAIAKVTDGAQINMARDLMITGFQSLGLLNFYGYLTDAKTMTSDDPRKNFKFVMVRICQTKCTFSTIVHEIRMHTMESLTSTYQEKYLAGGLEGIYSSDVVNGTRPFEISKFKTIIGDVISFPRIKFFLRQQRGTANLEVLKYEF